MKHKSMIPRFDKAISGPVAVLLLTAMSVRSAVRAEDDQEDKTLRIMTRNCFMGTDFPELLAARTAEKFIQAVTTTYQNVQATRPGERMAAIARFRSLFGVRIPPRCLPN